MHRNEKYTIEEISKLFEEKNYTLISKTYKNVNEKLDYICNKHKELNIQHVSLASFNLNECNCSGCRSEKMKNNWKKNHPKIKFDKEKYFKKYSDKLNKEVGNEYILYDIIKCENGKIILDLIHYNCGNHYIVDQYKFFHENNRCQNYECKFKRRSLQRIKNKRQLEQEIKDLVGNEYKIIGDYTGTNNNIMFQHNITNCNHKFLMTPHNFIQGGERCPLCAEKLRREKLTKTKEQYKEEIFDRFGGEYTVIGNYINNKSKIKIKHNDCGHIFSIISSKMFYNLSPCPFCERPTRGEQRIIDYLDSFMKNEYIYQKYYDNLLGIKNGSLSYDFYLPRYNLLIEYQGEFHDGTANQQTLEEFEIQKEHDRRKREYAKSHNINLLEIWYWDFDNIEEILYNYLKELDINNKAS